MAKAKAKARIEEVSIEILEEEKEISPLSKKTIYQKEIFDQYIDEQGYVIITDVQSTKYKLSLDQYNSL